MKIEYSLRLKIWKSQQIEKFNHRFQKTQAPKHEIKQVPTTHYHGSCINLTDNVQLPINITCTCLYF